MSLKFNLRRRPSHTTLTKDVDVSKECQMEGPNGIEKDLVQRCLNTNQDDVDSIKVDIVPEVDELIAAKLFHDVVQGHGLTQVRNIGPKSLVASGNGKDLPGDFWIRQDLIVRDYGEASPKYASLILRWMNVPDKLGGSFIATRLPSMFRKNSMLNKQKLKHNEIIEKIKGAWRASLYKLEYALEVAEFEGCGIIDLPDDEVEYSSSSDDDDDDDSLPDDIVPADRRGISAGVSSSRLKKIPSERIESMSKMRKNSQCTLTHRSASATTLVRRKSCLKINAPVQKKRLSVRFSAEEASVETLELSVEHREARMGVGQSAFNQFGQVRPLTNLRTGNLVFLQQESETEYLQRIKAREKEEEEKRHKELLKSKDLTPAKQRMRRRDSAPINLDDLLENNFDDSNSFKQKSPRDDVISSGSPVKKPGVTQEMYFCPPRPAMTA